MVRLYGSIYNFNHLKTITYHHIAAQDTLTAMLESKVPNLVGRQSRILSSMVVLLESGTMAGASSPPGCLRCHQKEADRPMSSNWEPTTPCCMAFGIAMV